jgi:hypothetical protein
MLVQVMVKQNTMVSGPVNGFNQNQRASKRDKCVGAFGRFFAAYCDAFESLELADCLLDPSSDLIERLGKNLCRTLVFDH